MGEKSAVGAAGVWRQRGSLAARRCSDNGDLGGKSTTQPLTGPNQRRRRVFNITSVSFCFQPFSLTELQFVESRQGEKKKMSLPGRTSLLFERRCSSSRRANKAKAPPRLYFRSTTRNRYQSFPPNSKSLWRRKPPPLRLVSKK